MRIKRTYPQPDSPQANLGPRERTLAALKYIGKHEPEACTLPHIEPRFARAVRLYESPHSNEAAAAEVIRLFLPLCEVLSYPQQHPLYPVILHSFQQEERKRRGLPLEPSLIPMLGSDRELDARVTPFGDEGSL